MADDERPDERDVLRELPDDGDGVQAAVDATQETVRSALDRIRESREILADSLKPIDDLLGDLRAAPLADRVPPRDAERGSDDGATSADAAAAPPPADAPPAV